MRRGLFLLLILVIIILSIRAIVFTINLVGVHYFAEKDEPRACTYLLKAIQANPAVHGNLPIAGINRDDFLDGVVKYMSRTGRLDLISDLKGIGISTSHLDVRYKDNFYYHNLRGFVEETHDWENLDNVSFYMVRDERFNTLTETILLALESELGDEFRFNLHQFAEWVGNGDLARFLRRRYPFLAERVVVGRHRRIIERESWAKWETEVARVLDKPWEPEDASTLFSDGFENSGLWERDWYFSDMADFAPYGKGSFTGGIEKTAQGNWYRIMGFFVQSSKNIVPPRGGIWMRRAIPVPDNFYAIGFDYLTETGFEKPSLWLCEGLEHFLPATAGKWRKLVCFLSTESIPQDLIRPLIRMWGTGSLLVDNVVICRLGNGKESRTVQTGLIIEDYEP